MAIFEARELSVGYGTPLLHNISFAIAEGELVGILGRNGSGKTTLMRGITGSLRRFSGSIWVRGEDCTHLKPKQLATRISLLPQNYEVLGGLDVRTVIAMGRYAYESPFGAGADREKIQLAARQTGVDHLLDRDCGKLSQGQLQLVMLARLLAQDTPVMLLDEPNGALDYDNTHTLFHKLRELVAGEGKASLLVLHDPELALKWCHRLLILRDGGICADLRPGKDSRETLQAGLARIYPNIHVRWEPEEAAWRCRIQEIQGGRQC